MSPVLAAALTQSKRPLGCRPETPEPRAAHPPMHREYDAYCH
jgi:hypothetical protein